MRIAPPAVNLRSVVASYHLKSCKLTLPKDTIIMYLIIRLYKMSSCYSHSDK